MAIMCHAISQNMSQNMVQAILNEFLTIFQFSLNKSQNNILN